MTSDEFAATLGLDGQLAADAYEVFRDELRAPQKTLAARCADLAEGLRRLDLTEEIVYDAVQTLAMERRR
ncbi:hypothetical protein [Nocardia abscessus]|uniref:hypothetical protein n=1 Tax=Nocardia abscessus TaxID=120957 RepID=UPI002457A125|nr:hypothetical protein [Nocardia abscessus]